MAAGDNHELKRHLQDCLGDGLAIIVGSGLSCAEGIPGMSALATHLIEDVPRHYRDERVITETKTRTTGKRSPI